MADIDAILKAIGLTESLGGKNTNHKTITYGTQKGDAAIGTYGLMPNTIREVAGSSADPDVQSLGNLPSEDIKTVLEQTPELQDKVAKELLGPILDRQGGDPAKAAYAWRWGHNLPAADVEKKGYMDKEHVQRFLRNLDTVSPKVAPPSLRSSPSSLTPGINELSPFDTFMADALKPPQAEREMYPGSVVDLMGQAQRMVDPTKTIAESPVAYNAPIPPAPLMSKAESEKILPKEELPEVQVAKPQVEEDAEVDIPMPASKTPTEEISEPAPKPEAPADTTDADFRNAQNERNRLAGLLTMARGGERIGSALAGTKSDSNYLSELTGLVNAPVEDMMTLQKLKSGKLQNAQMQRTLDLEKQKDDPNSELSRIYRDTAKLLSSRTDAMKGLNIPDNLSAGEMEKYSPMLFNLVSQDISRQSKLEVAKTKAEAQKQKDTEKKQESSKKVYAELTDKIQGNRKSPQVQNAEKNMLYIKNAEELLSAYPDLDKMPEDQVNTLRAELARIATGSVATAHAMKEIETKTLVSNWNKFLNTVSNKPNGAQMKEFLKNNVRYLGGLKRVQQEIIADNAKKLFHSRQDRMAPEDIEMFKEDYKETLNPVMEYSPQVEAGIAHVMQQNSIDRDKAIEALRNAGKL